jgi:hypothetical protein
VTALPVGGFAKVYARGERLESASPVPLLARTKARRGALAVGKFVSV